ncbi:MAG: class I SAM-dependent methyltransferase [bacterium]|nr:class I SAM-dependent methyltransferase [bacterium]
MGKSDRVCPVEHANSLDGKLRRFFQNPEKILSPYISEGMTVLDTGCGPGFFSIEIANMVGESGKVIAADLQQGMLDIVKKKVQNTALEKRIVLHKCDSDKIGVMEKVDLVLAFYMLHEVPDQKVYLQEMKSILKPGGKLLVIEPKFHVTKKKFAVLKQDCKEMGFEPIEEPKVFMSRAVLLKV